MKRLLPRTIWCPGMSIVALLVVLLAFMPLAVKSADLKRPPLARLPARTASTTLVISEVFYDAFGVEPDGEWIEIYNLGTTSLDLRNHKVGDERFRGGEEGMVRFPDGASIAPAQAIVVANRATLFLANYGFKPDYEILESDPTVPNMVHYAAWASGSLALHNDGDDVLLLDAGDRIVDALSWGVSTFAFNPSAPDIAEGHSLEREPASTDTDTASDWLNQATPNPGRVTVDLTVVSAADGGPGTLRWALLNARSGDTITFDPLVFPPGTPTTIPLLSVLPALTQDSVTIDASDAGVILDGSALTSGDDKGLVIEAHNCVVRGLTIQRFPSDGISIPPGASGNNIGGDRNVGVGPNGQGNLIILNSTTGIEIRGDDNRVQGNYIGIDGSGMGDAGNRFNGIAIWNGASGNTIGGTSPGQRNVISGNDQNGIWVDGTGTDGNVVIGNYVGLRADGMEPVSNRWSGVALQSGAQNNRIGGTGAGEGNLISGNTDAGIYISNSGTTGNRVLGNIIGPNREGTAAIDQGHHGVIIISGASDNQIGDGSAEGRNLISGNASTGVLIGGGDTMSNTVRGNYVGTNISGTAALPNGLHGVELNLGTSGNQVLGNLLSGNLNHGLVMYDGAHHNTVAGNIIGPDATGTYSLGNQPWGGIDIANGSHHNVIGGLGPGEGNLISGNQTDGIALFHTIAGYTTPHNLVLGNRIGLTMDGDKPLSNGKYGILGADQSVHMLIQNNTVAFHEYGVLVATCDGNTISQNAIYSNTVTGLRVEGDCIAPPEITGVSIGDTETVTGTTVPNARVEVFADDDDEGRVYEGFVAADADGTFVFSKPGGFASPNVTATSTDAGGNTSEFSRPAHLLWTLLLYFNGDNDLEEYMFDTLDNIVAAGPSPRANVLALVDGLTAAIAHPDAVLYDLTWGAATPLATPITLTGELNMGDGQTLVDFVTWGRAYYPARNTSLSILDHGGGWAPSPQGIETGTALAPHEQSFLGGGSGLSWDFTAGHDYLDSPEIRQAMAAIADDGADPLDVLFFDVCLMGLTEVAYQIHESADFFVSSQNIGWAPLGPQGRYVRLVQGIGPTTTSRQLAAHIVQAYAGSMPERHPFTISAVDLATLPTVVNAIDRLAVAISDTLTSPTRTLPLYAAYSATQKLDYDNDLLIEPPTDGVVDLYDLALHASRQFTDSNVIAAAQALTTALNTAVVAEQHRSGVPWIVPNQAWELGGVHGLSIFLPLGEDLEFPILITETSPISPGRVLTRNLRLRDTYSCDQLQFVCDTAWGALIDTYYGLVSTPVPVGMTKGPVKGLLVADVTPPRTAITITGAPSLGHVINVTWATTDTQTGVASVALWHHPPQGQWTAVETIQGSLGLFAFPLSERCENSFAVRATDEAGNVEPLEGEANTVTLLVAPCHRLYLPVVLKAR